MTRKFVRLAMVTVVAGIFVGCDKYNRAAISEDGSRIAFSLGDKGFVTDPTSEMYLFDVDSCSMKRMTFDDQCEGWADIKDEGLIYTKGKGVEGDIEAIGPKDEHLTIATGMANTPVILPNDSVFYSAVNFRKDEGERNARIMFNLWHQHGVEPLAALPVDKDRKFLFSTLPAFYGAEKLYYAIADAEAFGAQEKKQPGTGVFKVTIFSLDMATKKSTPVTEFEFRGKKDAKDFPVGYVELAISSDDKTLICCFLPPNKLSIEMFSDKLASTVYLVDVATGKQTLFRSDKNMYYPRWKEVRFSQTTKPSTQPATRAVQEPKFVYLSGTGFKEGRGVWISGLDRTSLKLADLPDKVMEGYTGWTWATEKRIAIFHVGKSGLVLVGVNEDGTQKRTVRLSMSQLMALKDQADVAGMMDYLTKQYESSAKLMGKREAAALKTGYDKAIEELGKKLAWLRKVKVEYEKK